MAVKSSDWIKVWDPLVRVFHWTVVIGVFGAYFIERPRDLHEALGWMVAGALVVRLIWGVAGSRYARFSQFVPGPMRLARYLVALVRGRERRHIGHNPAGGAMIVLLMGLLAALTLTGWMMGQDAWFGEAWVEDLHALLADGVMVCVALHVAGVIVESVRHRENLVRAMITGRKRSAAKDDMA